VLSNPVLLGTWRAALGRAELQGTLEHVGDDQFGSGQAGGHQGHVLQHSLDPAPQPGTPLNQHKRSRPARTSTRSHTRFSLAPSFSRRC
jgi:hypothetical protein